MKFFIETLGCKVNQYETGALHTLLCDRGHTSCGPEEAADAYIINTCAVTAESGRKSRNAIRRAKMKNPNAIIAVCGCFSQISPEEIEALDVDLIAGSGERAAFLDALEKIAMNDTSQASRAIDDPMKRRTFEDLPAGPAPGRTRALLKIQDGCDNFCAYCVIPYARGPVRSLPIEAAVASAERLRDGGLREIVITGIEISSYGKDFRNGTGLADLISVVSKAVPEMRLRLGSLEPRTVTEDFCAKIAEIPNLCPHFHLSLQSGCDDTLRRMKRRYDTATFYASVELLRKYFPNPGITADLIVGFPGESGEEFQKTLEFIQKCAFSAMHIFPYSIRPGTPAADMEGQVDKKTKAERAKRAKALAGKMRQEFLNRCVGTVQEVLFETEAKGISKGHAGNYCLVEVYQKGLKNRLCLVRIAAAAEGGLVGEVLDNR